MVLGHSLRDRGAKAKLVVLVTIDRVSPEAVSELKVWIIERARRCILNNDRLCTTM